MQLFTLITIMLNVIWSVHGGKKSGGLPDIPSVVLVGMVDQPIPTAVAVPSMPPQKYPQPAPYYNPMPPMMPQTYPMYAAPPMPMPTYYSPPQMQMQQAYIPPQMQMPSFVPPQSQLPSADISNMISQQQPQQAADQSSLLAAGIQQPQLDLGDSVIPAPSS